MRHCLSRTFSPCYELALRAIACISNNAQRALLTAAFMVAMLFVTGTAMATPPPVTIPDTTVDIGEWVTAAITSIGGVVAIVVGGYFAFLIIKKGMAWGRRALSG